MLISLIVPIYNAEKYIRNCVESILDQSFTDFELLLIDDGSSDDSLQIIQDFEQKDSRIKVFSHSNSGVSFTRNFGIKKSKGDFLLFIDADDWVEKDFIQDFVDAYSGNPEELLVADLIRNGIPKTGYETQSFDLKNHANEFIKYKRFLHNGGPCAKFFNRKILMDNQIFFNEKLTYGEDLVFLINYLQRIKQIQFLNSAKYHYEYNPNSASTKKHSFENYYVFFNELNTYKNYVNLTEKSSEKYLHILMWDVLESALNRIAFDENYSSYTKELKQLAIQLDYKFFIYAKPLRKMYFVWLKLNWLNFLKLSIQNVKKLARK